MPRNVMISTPTYDGKLSTQYVELVIQTMRLCGKNGIACTPLFIPHDVFIQRARNSTCQIALASHVDDIVFIDADIIWKPEDFLRLLSHDKEIVGGVYRFKSQDVIVSFRPFREEIKELSEDGLLEIEAIGTGFLRMKISAVKKLWEISDPYMEKGVAYRNIFEVLISKNGEFTGEDITMCDKFRSIGGQVFVDTKISCGHTGEATYNFKFEEAGKDNIT